MKTQLSKKHILMLALVALLALCAVAATLAFNVQRVQSNNVISFGSVKICVSEYELDANGNEVAFNPQTTTQAQSGTISRIVRVQNVGQQPAYVRVRLRMVAVSGNGEERDAQSNVAFNVNCDGDSAPWVCGNDGWYYYYGNSNGVLNAGESTRNLLDSLRFTGDFYQAAADSHFQLKVDAQAVQAKNQQAGDTPADVLDVQGWPEGE